MQQTRIEQGTPYYLSFIKTFPNIEMLAKANIDSVLKVWQGLGYYTRARNMHKAAQKIHFELNNAFPNNYKALKNIPGIGDYTAAAIASICYHEKVPAIDGNVNRIISRLFDISEPIDRSIGKAKIAYVMENAIKKTNKPGDLNQALMDFGSAICLPKNPKCTECCLLQKCLARKNKTIENRPIKSAKLNKKTRYFYYLYLHDKNFTYIKKRTGKDIWEGLYEFPLIESNTKLPYNVIINNKTMATLVPDKGHYKIEYTEQKPHILSHQIIKSTFVSIESKTLNKSEQFLKVRISDLKLYAFPKLISQFLIDQE